MDKTLEDIFNNLGMTNIWLSINLSSVRSLIDDVKIQTKLLMLQQWNSDKSSSSRGKTYSIFKENHCLENQFILLPQTLWTSLLKFRTSNHYLPIETGRWNNSPVDHRTCILCNNDIEDEFHYLFTYTVFLFFYKVS